MGISSSVSADIRKTVVVALYMACSVALVFGGKVDPTFMWGSVTTLVGIVIGNGKNALRGIVSAPMVKPTIERAQARLIKEYEQDNG